MGSEEGKRLEGKREGTVSGVKSEEEVTKGDVGRAKERGGGAKGEVGGAKGRGGGGGGGVKGGGREQRSRQSKEHHKGSRANHNRRALADRKRDRGMAGPARH